MKIIRPYARLSSPWAFLASSEEVLDQQAQRDVGKFAMQFIEWCARISHRAEDAQKEDSWKRFLQSVVMDHGDWSVVEHVSVSVDAVMDRGITHEWVRHRLFSYTQESTRFVNYEKKMPPSFIYPQVGVECKFCLEGDEPKHARVHDEFWSHQHGGPCPYDETWLAGISHSENVYRGLIRKGWRPQEARSVFPNALASRIISTTNLRCWRHMLIMRTSQEAHPQMRQITIPLLREFQETFPFLFDDIVPNEKQAIAMRKAQ